MSAANIDTTKQALSSLNPMQQISLVMDPIFREAASILLDASLVHEAVMSPPSDGFV